MQQLKVRKLYADNEVKFGTQDSEQWLYGIEAVAQLVGQRLNTWAGEWFLDLDYCTAWRKLYGKPYYDKLVEREIRRVVLDTDGVREFLSYEFTHDKKTRAYSIKFSYDTIYNNSAINSDTNQNADFNLEPLDDTALTVIWTLNVSRMNIDTILG